MSKLVGHKTMETANPVQLSWFTQTTAKYTQLIIELMVIAVVLRLLGLVQPFVFQTIIDRVLPFQREATLFLILAILVFTALFSAALDALSEYLGTHMANRLTAELARRIYDHVLNLPLRTLQKWHVGETLTRIGEIDTVRGFLTGTVSGAVLDVLFAGIYIGALLSISPFLTLVVVIILPLQMIFFGAFGPFIRQRMQAAFFAGSRHQSRLVETFGNAVTMKALACEAGQVERFQTTLRASLYTNFRVAKLHIANGVIGDILGNGSVILVIYFGSKLVFQNEITLGELIAFHLLADKVSGPIMSLSSVWEEWQGLRIARLRLGDLLNVAAETEHSKPSIRVDEPVRVTVHDVTFGYQRGEPILNNLSLNIEPGCPTIIIGESGCGKSTLAKIVSGLYEPDSGSVLVNHQALTDCAPHSVRRAIAYVPQDPALFSGSIRDNLLLAKPDATNEEIHASLVASASDRFVAKLANGIATDVGENGSNLSGGQRQRLALARSFLSDPQALILDEPTSALDEHSSAIVVNTLMHLAATKTVVVVTHNAALFGRDVRVIDLTQHVQERSEPILEGLSA